MNRLRRQHGMTLPEVLVASTILLFVVIAIYTMITTTQTTHLTEGRKLDMNQGSRVIAQVMSDALRSAGAVLTLANTPSMLGAGSTIPFNGLYPLNNSGAPDGLIVAAGDPQAMVMLTGDFTPGDTTVNVPRVTRQDGTVAWSENDLGLVMRPDGYYVFRVTETPGAGDTELTVRANPAYFSGLLDSGDYDDISESMLGTSGNSGSYPVGRPVVRLNYFYLFAARAENDGSYTLTLTTDFEGAGADLFSFPATANRAVPILPNLVDLQIEYITEENPPVTWASLNPHPNPCGNAGASWNAAACSDFVNLFFTKTIQSARVFALMRTEEETNKISGSGITYNKPVMGDTASQTIPVGRFHYNYIQFEVFIRNFSNVF